MAKSKPRSWRRSIIVAAIILAVSGVAFGVWWRKREPAILVQTEKAVRRNITEVVIANGRIQPVVQVKISPEVSGEIIALPVKEGQIVNKGDLLLKIKPDFYEANRRSAEANYKSSASGKDLAEANLRKAQAEFKRMDDLFANQLVSEANHVDAQAALDVAKASFETSKHQVNVAMASLDRASEELAKTTIYSPLTGTVSKLNSQLGERVVGTAMMTGTEVMTIADLDEMEARVDIGEVDVVLIAHNQVAALEVDAFRDRKFNGVVTEIANSAKGAGVSSGSGQEATKFEVKIRIREKAIFRPGMSVTAEIETQYRTNVLSVPIQSVTTRLPKGPKEAAKPSEDECQDEETSAASSADAGASKQNSAADSPSAAEKASSKSANIDAAVPKPIEVVFAVQGDRTVMFPVKRGISDDAYTEIVEGIQEGQEIVSGGYKAISRDLEDGKKIEIGPAKTESGKEKDAK